MKGMTKNCVMKLFNFVYGTNQQRQRLFHTSLIISSNSIKREHQKANKYHRRKDRVQSCTIQIDSCTDMHVPVFHYSVDHTFTMFRDFQDLCMSIQRESSHKRKSIVVKEYIVSVPKQNQYVLLKLLLPGIVKRVYNLKDKGLLKLFSKILNANHDAMKAYQEKGDVAQTIGYFFFQSSLHDESRKSSLSLNEVDDFLEELSQKSKAQDMQDCLYNITLKCTRKDLEMLVNLIKCDLRIDAGAKRILDGFHKDAYESFKTTGNLQAVVEQLVNNGTKSGMSLDVEDCVEPKIMTPVSPMLASPCRVLSDALRTYKEGLYVDIKYDGERIQVHSASNVLQYYSRSLKPVVKHKVEDFDECLPLAFPNIDNYILDCELVLLDKKTNKPLPFGTLGKNEKALVKDASSCLFVFDCLYCNGENLISRPLFERRLILKEKIHQIPNQVMLPESRVIEKDVDQLTKVLEDAFARGHEGLILKDKMGIYEPGKRRWLKVKKQLSDIDLVVLGAYYGTGKKGGMMSSFLMGTYDFKRKRWYTVTKASSGLTMESLKSLQTGLEMVNIGRDINKVPAWLSVNHSLVPDFVVKDPKLSVVWEITGGGLTKSPSHTADGISIRFPIISRMRPDKDWTLATDISQLRILQSVK